MVAHQHGPLFTHEEYEEFEERASERHEYHSGYVYAMSGGTLNHSQISGEEDVSFTTLHLTVPMAAIYEDSDL